MMDAVRWITLFPPDRTETSVPTKAHQNNTSEAQVVALKVGGSLTAYIAKSSITQF